MYNLLDFFGSFLVVLRDLTVIVSLQIIPPGMEFHHIVPQDVDGETETNEDHPTSPDPPIWSEVIVIPSAFALLSTKRQLISCLDLYLVLFSCLFIFFFFFFICYALVICR